MRALAALLLLAASLTGCSEAPDGEASTPGGDAALGRPLSGVVVDEAIRPLPGVRVELDGSANATTGADGQFRFDAVAVGAHVVRAAKAGFADAVAQVTVESGGDPALVKLVLVTDTLGMAFAETTAIDGFVECGMYFGSYFAACGAPNVGSFILCAQTSVCMGNLTGDRYIVIQRFDRTPTFLVTETAWTSTQALGERLAVWLGSADKEQLTFQPDNTPSVWNRTQGPSPLYGTMNATMLAESGIGQDSWFLAQVFAADEESIPVSLGATVQQRFQMFLTVFYGYAPPSDWRFTESGVAPPPPTSS